VINPEASTNPESAAEPSELQIEWQTFTIKGGDTLSAFSSGQAWTIPPCTRSLNGSGNTDELTRLRQGREIEFGFDQDGEFAGLVIHNSRTTKLKALRDDDGFHTIEEMREPEIELAFAGGEIQTSFALAANRAGLSGNVRNKLSRIFGWEIDFRGIFERATNSGSFTRNSTSTAK